MYMYIGFAKSPKMQSLFIILIIILFIKSIKSVPLQQVSKHSQ